MKSSTAKVFGPGLLSIVGALVLAGSASAAVTAVPAECPSNTEYNWITATTGWNFITGTDADEQVNGTDGPDYMTGLGGKDTLFGVGGNDCLRGGDGDDVANGGGGDDWIYGGNQQDDLSGDGGADYISGGADKDILDGGIGEDILSGGGGDEISGSRAVADTSVRSARWPASMAALTPSAAQAQSAADCARTPCPASSTAVLATIARSRAAVPGCPTTTV